MLKSRGIISTFVVYIYVRFAYCDLLKPAAPSSETHEEEFQPISSRNYGNNVEASNNYYTTYPGYQTYGSSGGSNTFSDPYNSPEYTNYFVPGQDTKKKPAQPSYPTYSSLYPSPGVFGSPECNEQMMNGVIGDILQTSGVGNYGLLKSVVAAVTAGILAKIPIILAIKALIVKLILVPLGFVVLALPFILPILLLFTPLWTKLKEAFTGTTPSPTMVVMMAPNVTNTTQAKAREMNYGRQLLMTILESDRCFEKLACLLGSKDATSPYIKSVSWLLKFLQSFKFVQNNIEIRNTLKRYRDAYLEGVTLGKKQSTRNATGAANICLDDTYPCNIPVFISKPEFTEFSRYL